MKKNIAVVTGSRAEYGLLKPLIRAIAEEPSFNLQLIATGMHLSAEFGSTYKEIEADGISIAEKVDCKLSSDSAEAITESIGTALQGFAKAYKKLDPYLIVLLGDRTEILAAAIAASIKALPIAHIHGGETTEGSYDEASRHAITKMSFLHFTSAEAYRKRVIQLGEAPERVFNVGAIGIDSIKKLPLLSRADFENAINFKLDKKNILITFHPVTLENKTAEHQFKALLNSMDKLKDTSLIFTKPNSDKDGAVIVKMIDAYVSANSSKAVSFTSLGQLRYLSALQYVDLVIGNSSSGILEVPSFKKPTINMGDRQKGRLMPESIINCEPNEPAIDQALNKSFSPEFLKNIQGQNSLYGDGNTTPQIMKILTKFETSGIKKPFYDIKF